MRLLFKRKSEKKGVFVILTFKMLNISNILILFFRLLLQHMFICFVKPKHKIFVTLL
jgi:hypothetical protein